jgi:hypothetical protein
VLYGQKRGMRRKEGAKKHHLPNLEEVPFDYLCTFIADVCTDNLKLESLNELLIRFPPLDPHQHPAAFLTLICSMTT